MHKIVTATLFLFGLSLAAQDTRTVTEPKIPPTCQKLYANKYGDGEGGASDKTSDTARIQKALDTCKQGHAVELSKGERTRDGFVSGSLELREGVTLLIDKGVTLYGSRDPKDYDANPSGDGPLLCGTMSSISRVYVTAKEAAATGKSAPPPPQQGRTCKSLISINVKNAAIMGAGTIDGRGGAQVIGHDYTWWQMARAAEPKQLAYYSGRLITASHADGLILYGIHLHNAPNCHVCVNNTNGFTAWGVHLQTPTVKGTDARNTDGIDPGSSTNVTVAHSWVDNGDDNIAIKSNVSHMSVLHNHFYNGHGMSIGSEVMGDNFLLVDDLSLDHTTSGIRIKSNPARGGLVHDLIYKNICMRNVQVPISISPYYNNGTTEGFTDPNIAGDKIPDYKKISLLGITATTPGDVLIAGKDKDHITEVTLNGVYITGIKPEQVHAQFANVKSETGGVNFRLRGEGVTSEPIFFRYTPHQACPESSFPPYQ